jgi:hypothetical protein
MFCVSCPNFLKANLVVAYGCLSLGIVSSRLLIPLAGDRMSIRGWGLVGLGLVCYSVLEESPLFSPLCIGLGQVGVYPWMFRPGVKESRPLCGLWP